MSELDPAGTHIRKGVLRTAVGARGSARLAVLGLALLLPLSGCRSIEVLKARRIAREGNDLYRAADYDGAIAKYHEALAIDPETPNTYLNLGFALLSRYNPASSDPADSAAGREAVEAFSQHLLRHPKDERAISFRIKTFLRAAPHDEQIATTAHQAFLEMLAKNPHDEEAKQYLVTLLSDTKAYARALEYFGPAVEKNPDDLEAMKVLAMVADKSDKVQEAARWYRQRATRGADPEKKASMFYELGTYAWNTLHYRPDAVSGIDAIKIADEGLAACRQAMALKAEYAEAMVYANLLLLKRAIYEPTLEAKEMDNLVAFELRSEAARLLKARQLAAAAAKPQDAAPKPREGKE